MFARMRIPGNLLIKEFASSPDLSKPIQINHGAISQTIRMKSDLQKKKQKTCKKSCLCSGRINQIIGTLNKTITSKPVSEEKCLHADLMAGLMLELLENDAKNEEGKKKKPRLLEREDATLEWRLRLDKQKDGELIGKPLEWKKKIHPPTPLRFTTPEYETNLKIEQKILDRCEKCVYYGDDPCLCRDRMYELKKALDCTVKDSARTQDNCRRDIVETWVMLDVLKHAEDAENGQELREFLEKNPNYTLEFYQKLSNEQADFTEKVFCTLSSTGAFLIFVLFIWLFGQSITAKCKSAWNCIHDPKKKKQGKQNEEEKGGVDDESGEQGVNEEEDGSKGKEGGNENTEE